MLRSEPKRPFLSKMLPKTPELLVAAKPAPPLPVSLPCP